MKFTALLGLAFLLAVCAGCGRPHSCNSCCGGKPSCKKQCYVSEKTCIQKSKCNPCRSDCVDKTFCYVFMHSENPLGNPQASAAEKIAYAKLGYECAKDKGMVPLSPRFGVPALDCPWIRSVDTTAVCPAPCSSCGPVITEKPTERGYLLTAFDTPRGTRYVMIESERDFSPTTTLTDVEKDFNNLVETLRGLDGKVVVYLTSFPLITPRNNETSRVLRDLEINSFKSALQEKAGNINFVNWQ